MIGGFNSWSDFQEGPIPVGICDSAKAGFIFQPRQGRPLFLAAVEARFFRAVKFFYVCSASSSALEGCTWTDFPPIMPVQHLRHRRFADRFQESDRLWLSLDLELEILSQVP